MHVQVCSEAIIGSVVSKYEHEYSHFCSENTLAQVTCASEESQLSLLTMANGDSQYNTQVSGAFIFLAKLYNFTRVSC